MGVCYELRLHEMADYMKVSFTSTDFIYDSFFLDQSFYPDKQCFGIDHGGESDGYNFWMAWI